MPADRPKFRQVLLSLLGDDGSLLAGPGEDGGATHSLAGVLGSPLEAGHSLYLTTQHRYQQSHQDIQMTEM